MEMWVAWLFSILAAAEKPLVSTIEAHQGFPLGPKIHGWRQTGMPDFGQLPGLLGVSNTDSALPSLPPFLEGGIIEIAAESELLDQHSRLLRCGVETIPIGAPHSSALHCCKPWMPIYNLSVRMHSGFAHVRTASHAQALE
jgi:hypothetical protein